MPKLFIALMFMSFAIFGFLDGYLFTIGIKLPPTYACQVIVTSILCFLWCKADIKRRNIPEPKFATFLAGLLAIVGIPAYFFRTMPIKKAFIATIQAILIFILLMLTNFAMFFCANIVKAIYISKIR